MQQSQPGVLHKNHLHFISPYWTRCRPKCLGNAQVSLWKPSGKFCGLRASRQPLDSSGVPQKLDTSRLQCAPSWIATPSFFLIASTCYAAITADLFAPWGSRWLLNNIDKPTHFWVVEHLSKFVRDMVFEIGVSNIAIVLGCLGWALCSSILFNDSVDERTGITGDLPAREQLKSLGSLNFKRLIAVWTLYFSAGGFLLPGDNFLVAAFKHTFNRVRPSTRHKSFSFPSGHTTAVTYIVGILLFALLPYLLELLETRKREPNKVVKLGVLNKEGIQKLIKRIVENGPQLWIFAIVSTAGGRILGDVHWVTDTLAGACLGSAVVSGYLILSAALQARKLAGNTTGIEQ